MQKIADSAAKHLYADRLQNDAVRLLKYIPYDAGAASYAIGKGNSGGGAAWSSDFPVPPVDLWMGYATTAEDYVQGGKVDVEVMLRLLQSDGFAYAPGDRVLDFGCGPGRMLRHLTALAGQCEVWGTDISASYICWCQQNLSPPFRFATTTTIPHLPFEDRYFRLVYCGSVFTHIEDLAEAWLLELRRVLTPGGRLYLTIHDRHTIELLRGPSRDCWLARRMNSHKLFEEQADQPFAMLVIGRDARSQVFYDREWFCDRLEKLGLRVVSVTPEAYGYQTALVVEKV